MPTKDYINGSDKCKLVLIDSTGVAEEINVSYRYTEYNEYDQGIATRHKFRAGNKAKLFHHIDMIFEVSFAGLLENPDAQLINRVKNAEIDNKTIWLIPHTDLPTRGYKVQILEDSRKLGQYYNIDKTGANKDYILLFENVDALNYYDWLDPDYFAFNMSEEILVIN